MTKKQADEAGINYLPWKKGKVNSYILTDDNYVAYCYGRDELKNERGITYCIKTTAGSIMFHSYTKKSGERLLFSKMVTRKRRIRTSDYLRKVSFKQRYFCRLVGTTIALRMLYRTKKSMHFHLTPEDEQLLKKFLSPNTKSKSVEEYIKRQIKQQSLVGQMIKEETKKALSEAKLGPTETMHEFYEILQKVKESKQLGLAFEMVKTLIEINDMKPEQAIPEFGSGPSFDPASAFMQAELAQEIPNKEIAAHAGETREQSVNAQEAA